MKVKDILDSKGTEVVTTGADVTLAALTRVLATNRIGAVLVMNGEAVVGIVSERDIVTTMSSRGGDALGCRVSEVMTVDVVTCAPDDAIETIMSTMTDRRVRHMPVIEHGRLAGVISIGDVVKLRLGEVESEARMLRDYIEAR
jgi:CBS domain-containing protein